jgi:hypothetical protein
MPLRHSQGLDPKLVSSMRHDGLLEDEKEKDSRERLLEAQYGAANLRGLMNARYLRGAGGKSFRTYQKLDGIHMDKPRSNVGVIPLDPDYVEKESDMVRLLQDSVSNSEALRNKYLTGDQGKSRVFRKQ